MAKTRRTVRGRVAGMLAHTELASDNPEATRKFLGKVFGWKFQAVRSASRNLVSYETPGGSHGSIRPTRPTENPSSINYILVDDLETSASKIRRSGGEIVLPRVDVPEMGSFFWFKVPGGPVLACWQDAAERKRNPAA